MAFEWANAVLLNDLELWLGLPAGPALLTPTLHVHLYSARTAPPSAISTLADFTELIAPPDTGYTPAFLSMWSPAFLDSGHYKSQSNLWVFTNTDLVTSWTAFLGYYLTDPGDAVFLGGEELGVPVTLAAGLSFGRTLEAQDINEF